MAASRSLALECKTGGLVISRHNEIRDELSDLAPKALSPSSACNEPKIHNSRTMDSKLDEEHKDDPVKRLFCNSSCKEDRGEEAFGLAVKTASSTFVSRMSMLSQTGPKTWSRC
jgi:hypothetical protein